MSGVLDDFVKGFELTFTEQNGASLDQAWRLYLEYCGKFGVIVRLSMNLFRDELKSYFEEFHDRVMHNGILVRNYYRGFKTLHRSEKIDHNEEFVSKFYEMNPETDDILYDGTELRDGMEVLIESCDFRQEIKPSMTDGELERARRYNRWAKVTRAEAGDVYASFIAVYFDGSKKKLTTDRTEAWLVKIDSLEDAEALAEERHKNETTRKFVIDKVWVAMNYQPPQDSRKDSLREEFAERITDDLIDNLKDDNADEQKNRELREGIKDFVVKGMERDQNSFMGDEEQLKHIEEVTDRIIALL